MACRTVPLLGMKMVAGGGAGTAAGTRVNRRRTVGKSQEVLVLWLLPPRQGKYAV